MRTLPFSVRRGDCAAVLRDGTIRAEAAGRRLEIPVSELRIKGMHNTYDAMAAVLAALSAGIEPDAILPTLRSFEGVEHRLEPCGEIDGVEYVNDSKATNVDSVWYALESMTRPVVWIAGGTDKGNDYSRLYDLAGAKVKALVCMGRRQREADPCLRRAHSPHRGHALARRRDGCGAGCGFLRRYGAAFAGLRELRPVQELRGTGASVQGVGGDALAEAPLTTAVPGLAFRRREGRRTKCPDRADGENFPHPEPPGGADGMWSGEAMSRSEACGRAYSSGPFLGTDGGGGPAGDAHEELKENRWNGTEREYPENGNAGAFGRIGRKARGFSTVFSGETACCG